MMEDDSSARTAFTSLDVEVDDTGAVRPAAAPSSSKPATRWADGSTCWNNVRKLQYSVYGLGTLCAVFLVALIAVAATGHGGGGSASAGTQYPPSGDPSTSLSYNMVATNLWKTLHGLSEVGLAHGGSRSVTTGANASVAYMMDRVQRETNFDAHIETFDVETAVLVRSSLTMAAPTDQTYQFNQDYSVRQGQGQITNKQVVYLPDGGCNIDAAVVENKIVLFQGEDRDCGGVSTQRGALLQAGVAAILYYYPGQSLPILSTLAGGATAPIFFVSQALGDSLIELVQDGPVRLGLESVIDVDVTVTTNLIVDANDGGDEESVVLVGSHIDSVPAGIGMNDDGSGSTTNLEILLQYNKLFVHGPRRVVNHVRFCFFGAEELGLLGSYAYAASLTASDTAKYVIGMVDYDMFASPNGAYQVYNGSSSTNAAVKAGSGYIQSLFVDYFAQHNLNSSLIKFDGRSDYAGFLDAGIPAGGIATGAEVLKTVEERDKFGGLPHVAYDPCYHQACDTLENIDMMRMIWMARAAANAVDVMASDPDARTKLGRPKTW